MGENDTPAYNPSELDNRATNANLLRYITAWRRYGHITAKLDPLGLSKKSLPPEMDLNRYKIDKNSDKEIPLPGLLHIRSKNKATFEEIEEHLKKSYGDSVGSEFLFLQDVVQRRWFSDQIEQLPDVTFSKEEKLHIYQLLSETEVFDHFMQRKFPYVKRYSLEGTEAMIPAIDTIFKTAANMGFENIVIAMPHRGRLNFLTGLLRYPARNFFWKVQGNSEFPEGIDGIGDVLSHIGQSIDLEYEGKSIHVTLLQNPSHLENGNPVAMGKARAKQFHGADINREKTLCVMFHGDAAFYGQGSVAETLGLSKLEDFTVGGTIHIIVNNQLGFTTPANHARSSRYSADIGKIIDMPALHVNADIPEDVCKVAKLATEYRQKFKSDIILDIIGYRRHGHNELDEPSFTSPNMYKNITSRRSVASIYGEQLQTEGILAQETVDTIKKNADAHLASELTNAAVDSKAEHHLQGNWKGFIQAKDIRTVKTMTGVAEERLKDIALKSVSLPSSLKIHPRLKRAFVSARETAVQKDEIDWPTAEAMAIGSLLADGHHVRICGQDVGRGTFSQRHFELIDQDTEKRYVPLNNIGPGQGKLEVVNSPLSELAVLSYEYGYSTEHPQDLVIWEAQFGDFANSAQVAIDQFISCGETKWLKQSGMVMLLPHGMDGAGPEHSSSRPERFLQNVEQDSVDLHNPRNKNCNMYVVNITTPANYFHALRRQMKTPFRKPMIVMGPKTILRDARARSKLEEMNPSQHFLPVLDEKLSADSIERVMFCSGKVYYDLVQQREAVGYNNTAIIRIEELAPFPLEAVTQVLARYNKAKEYIWIQDEIQNGGAWFYMQPRLNTLIGQAVKYIGRPPCAASATGIGVAFKKESADILKAAFPK